MTNRFLRRAANVLASRATAVTVAIVGPALLTVVLHPLGQSDARDFVFLYLGLVAALGLGAGPVPAYLAAAESFLLVDYYFVPPVGTLTIADEADVVDLVVFFATAALVGAFGSRRRRAQLRAEAMAADLRLANTQLERLNAEQLKAAEVAVRLARSEQQVELLKETDRLRRDLLANVSHELRTPLGTVLTGTTSLLARPSLTEQEVRSRMEVIEREARRLDRLVGDMLDMARIEGGALDLRLGDVALSDAIRAAVERLQQAAPQRSVTVTIEPADAEVVADWDRLAQILDNLLLNANRHSPSGGVITVAARANADPATSTAMAMTTVSVIDEGPGVAEDLRDRVFERFVSSAASARGTDDDSPSPLSTAGLGLGLPIVRGLVEAQAGRVWIEDDDVHGHFSFCLPQAASGLTAARRDNVDVDVTQ